MRSLPVAEAPVKAFYAHLYDQAVTLVKTAGQIWVVREASIEPFEIEMAPFTCVLGEVGLSDRWYLNAFLYSMTHDEALALLPSGAIIRFFVNQDNMVDVEVDYDEC